jgi:NTE family protein
MKYLLEADELDIDGVFSGGGIKGLAFVGAYQELEKRGYRFKRLAGTSAGSIVAAMIAAGYNSKEMLDELNSLEAEQILDEQRSIFPFKFIKWIPIYWRLGLYKGQALENWIDERLKKKGVKTFGDLPPGGLRVVASDLTNGKILIIPDDLYKYNIPFESFSVAKAVRMSCSLPYFFEPVRLKTSEGKVIIVDGGVLSNFPMWLFDQENVKKIRPVLGLKLSPDYKNIPPNEINNALQMFEALFTTMKDAHDARYISRKHEKNIIFIPTEGILTTEFGLTEEKKQELVNIGREQTIKFLQKWTY